jgi:hypothetical protein
LTLRDLQVSVIPSSFLAPAIAAARAGAASVLRFTTELPTAHFNVLMYVVSFLRFLLRPTFAVSNELTAQGLGQMFAAVLFSLSSQNRPALAQRPGWLRPVSSAAASALAAATSLAGASSGSAANDASAQSRAVEAAASAASTAALREQADEELSNAVKFLVFLLS